jgi:hypothetical protein
MSDETFVEGVLGVGFGKGAIRIDFYGIAEGVDEKGHPARERKHRLIMTMESFVESFNTLQNVMQKLKEGGMVQDKPAAPGAEGAKEEAPAAPSGVSPNF